MYRADDMLDANQSIMLASCVFFFGSSDIDLLILLIFLSEDIMCIPSNILSHLRKHPTCDALHSLQLRFHCCQRCSYHAPAYKKSLRQ